METAMVTLGNLLQKHNWGDIKVALLSAYPDQETSLEGYSKVIGMLRDMPPAPTCCTIFVSSQVDDFDGTEYEDVTGRMPDDELSHSLIATKWPEWLSMQIDNDSLDKFGEVGVLAHCLYEMTFVGYSPEELEEFKCMLDERMAMVQEAPDLHLKRCMHNDT